MIILFNEPVVEMHIGCNLLTRAEHFGFRFIDYHLVIEQNFSRPFKGFASPHKNRKRGLDRPPIIYKQGFRLR